MLYLNRLDRLPSASHSMGYSTRVYIYIRNKRTGGRRESDGQPGVETGTCVPLDASASSVELQPVP